MKYVAYYRVSTKKQDLGIPAQKQMVKRFLKDGDEVIASFEEKESGSNKDRVQLNKALALCEKEGATLLIAKLDRLARNLNFITSLMESGTEFTAIDLPEANKLTIHFMAAYAEHELETTRERTIKALEQIKSNIDRQGYHISKSGNRISSLGGSYQFSDRDQAKSREALKARRLNNENNKKAKALICELHKQGATLQAICDSLMSAGFKTARGKREWRPVQVKRLVPMCN